MRIEKNAVLAALALLVCAPAAAQGVTAASPNQALSPAETVWHLRAALNVAALGCRGPGEAATVAGYNALLASEKAALAEALAAVAARYEAQHGAQWQARFDDAMTKLYNYWAQPTAHDGFCGEAENVMREAATVAAADFAAFAAAALPRLDAPFQPSAGPVAGEPASDLVATAEIVASPIEAEGALPPTVIARAAPIVLP